MKILLSIIIAVVLGYFLGSINVAIISVKALTGKDIRTMGSKNAGLTNTLRCAGKTCALITLVGDMLKAVLAVSLSMMICRLIGGGIVFGENYTAYAGYVAGISAVAGHMFPIYHNFKGGKGVLVSASALLVIDPRVFITVLSIFIVILAISKYVSLASIFSAVYCPVAVLLMSWAVEGYSFGISILYCIFALIMASLIIWKHKDNIQRMLNNTENKFSFKTQAEKSQEEINA